MKTANIEFNDKVLDKIYQQKIIVWISQWV